MEQRRTFISQLDATDIRDFVLIALFVLTLAVGAALGSGA